MPLRLALLLLVTGLAAGCVSSGHDSPLQTGKGRDEARVAYVQLGLGYLRQGMSEQAKVPLKKALELDGSDADANAALALVFQASGRSQKGQLQLAGKPVSWRLQNSDQGLLLSLVAARPLRGDWAGEPVQGRWRVQVKLHE